MDRKTRREVGRFSPANIVFNICNYGILIFLSFLCLYPVIHILMASFSDPDRLIAYRGMLFKPLGFTLEGYKMVFRDGNVITGYKNTLIYVSLGTLMNMVMTIMGAFTLSRRDLMLKKPIMLIITIQMFFSGGLIPWFLLMKQLGLYGNLWAMIIPGAISTWDMIILRTGFQSLPQELEEAAIIDGASQAAILTKILLPLSKPVLAVVFLYYLVGHWNSWFNAMVLLQNKRDMYPLQLFLKELLIENSSVFNNDVTSLEQVNAYAELTKYCTIVVSTAPILCVYPFLQKYFVKGVMLGSLKG